MHQEDFYDDDHELERQTLLEQFDETMTLSYKERLIGFGVCFIIGWVVSMASISGVVTIVTNPSRFALLYTIGNIVSLCSTMFLYGPMEQVKTMFHPSRYWATWTYIASIIATLVAARSSLTFLVFVLMFIQLCAMVWYCSSFIPWGRKILKGIMTSCLGCNCFDVVGSFWSTEAPIQRSTDDELMEV